MRLFTTILLLCWGFCSFAETPTFYFLEQTENDSVSAILEDTLSVNTQPESIQVVGLDTTVQIDSVGENIVLTSDSLQLDSLGTDSAFVLTTDSLLSDSLLQKDTLHAWTDTTYWKTVRPWYVIFDSMTVNPYHIDGGKYKDSTLLVLYDSLKGNWSMPLKDHYVTSKFGQRGHRHHYGTDLRLSIGDTVRSVFDGIIRISKYNRGGYGHYVMVRHYNGTETIYGHLSKRIAKVGQHVKAGDVIGLGGNTGRSSGPHLHFEVRYQGNAIDPKHVWSFESDTIRSDTLLLTPKHYEYIRHARRAVYHRVRSGESLWTISRRYRVSIRQICRLNGITKRTVIRVGRRLRVR